MGTREVALYGLLAAAAVVFVIVWRSRARGQTRSAAAGPAGGSEDAVRSRWQRDVLVLGIVAAALYAISTLSEGNADDRLAGHEDYKLQPPGTASSATATITNERSGATAQPRPAKRSRERPREGRRSAPTTDVAKPRGSDLSGASASPGKPRRSPPKPIPVPRVPASKLPPVPAQHLFPRAPAVPAGGTQQQVEQEFDDVEEVAELPHTAEAGCEEVVAAAPGSPALWGPPAPLARVSRDGKLVLANFEFKSLPESRACKPIYVDVVVLAHDANNKHRSSSRRVRVTGLLGSAQLLLPEGASEPPYFARVRALAEDLRPSREWRIQLP